MIAFKNTAQWQGVQRWLEVLDAWTQKRSTGSMDDANAAFPVNAQTWFKQGVDALNTCLYPDTAQDFLVALQSMSLDMDTVHRMLLAQDLAWQPNPHAPECIAGATIWCMNVATLAARTQWDLGDLEMREQALTSLLWQWEGNVPDTMRAWHEGLCQAQPWALSATFDWAIRRPVPESLHWVYLNEKCPTGKSMTRLMASHTLQHTPWDKQLWEQLERLRPDLANYIDLFMCVHRQLGVGPDSPLGSTLAQSWRAKESEYQSIAPDLFALMS